MKKYLVTFFAFLLLAATTSSYAGEYEKAVELFLRDKPEEAAAIFKRDAQKGIKESQFNLGLLYDSGRGLKHDEKLAFKWYKKAADQGLPAAQYACALYYRQGKGGVRKNDKKAFALLSKAAHAGEAAAMNNLGFMYANGYGSKKDVNEAFKWYKKSLDSGQDMAKCNLAEMYMEGIGTERNESLAVDMILDGFALRLPYCGELIKRYEDRIARVLALKMMSEAAAKAKSEAQSQPKEGTPDGSNETLPEPEKNSGNAGASSDSRKENVPQTAATGEAVTSPAPPALCH